MNLNIFATAEEQIGAITRHIIKLIEEILTTKNRVILAVSGGKSPIKIFDALSKADLPWQKITITLVDERIVSTTSKDSNEHLVQSHLLKNKAALAKFVGLMDHLDGSVPTKQLTLAVPLAIDLAILGMGEDGHIASIFPDCKELEQALDLNQDAQYLITNPNSAKYQRISLSLAGLCKIPHLILNLNSATKLNIFKESMLHKNLNYPISYLIHRRPDLNIFWHD